MKDSTLIRVAMLSLMTIIGCHCDEISPLGCQYDYQVQLMGDSHTWLEGYSDMVEAEFADGQVVVAAKSGLTTNDHLPGGEWFNIEKTPRVVSILLSTNDSWKLGNTPEQVSNNLSKIAQAHLDAGACKVVIMTPPPIHTGPRAHVLVREYSDAITSLCTQPDDPILCGPDLQKIFGPEHLSDDNLHPSALGHQLIFDELMPFLVSDEIAILNDIRSLAEPSVAE